MGPTWVDAGVLVLVLLTLGLTALAAALLWRDGYIRGFRAARGAPPRCPRCGYDLSGLTYCRCPECGTEYSVDELWRACGTTPRQSEITPRASAGTTKR